LPNVTDMLKLELHTDNADFDDGREGRSTMAQLLRQLANTIENSRRRAGDVRDTNGNTIGHWSLTERDGEDHD
jgi:hypothetical protein